MILRLIILALALYVILAAPSRMVAAEPPRAYTSEPPAKLSCYCGTSCTCLPGVCPSRCPALQAAPQVQYQLYQVTQGRRTWYEYRAVSTSGVVANTPGVVQGGCANGQCPLPRR